MNTKKILLGMFASLAAGVSLGILFSPDKGSDSKSKILKKKEDLLDGMEDKLIEIAKIVMKKYNNLSIDEIMNTIKADCNKTRFESTDSSNSKNQ